MGSSKKKMEVIGKNTRRRDDDDEKGVVDRTKSSSRLHGSKVNNQL